MFGMILRDTLKRFIGKPSNSFQFSGKQQASVDSYAHRFLTKNELNTNCDPWKLCHV